MFEAPLMVKNMNVFAYGMLCRFGKANALCLPRSGSEREGEENNRQTSFPFISTV